MANWKLDGPWETGAEASRMVFSIRSSMWHSNWGFEIAIRRPGSNLPSNTKAPKWAQSYFSRIFGSNIYFARLKGIQCVSGFLLGREVVLLQAEEISSHSCCSRIPPFRDVIMSWRRRQWEEEMVALLSATFLLLNVLRSQPLV